MRRPTEQEQVQDQVGSPVGSTEMLDSPTRNYNVMMSRGDSQDIPDQDYLPQPPAREIFRQPSEAQTIDSAGGYGTNGFGHRATEGGAYSPRSSTYSYSGGNNGGRTSASSAGYTAAAAAHPGAFTRGTLWDRDIEAISDPTADFLTKTQRYKGRYRMWPGILLLIAIVAGGTAGITLSALHTQTTSTARQEAYAKRQADSAEISGGVSGSDSGASTDGVVGNPNSYPDMGCELPDYQSKNGRIYAVSSNGTEIPLDIKGINWFGMETGTAIPLGLWDNSENGTTAFQIAYFLEKNKFNAVRLPLCVDYILTNQEPETSLINTAENSAISVKNYLSLLKSLVKALAYRNIGVLISMHTLTSTDDGGLWYSDTITQDDFLDAIDTLTSNLCSKTYWNIIGIDLKNEPYDATWGDGADTDWLVGAKTIGDRIMGGCSNWLGFVEGIYAEHSLTIDGTEYDFYDWYGSGLQNANDYPLSFNVSNKVVYAPHYYTPAVYPQAYFYDGGTSDDNGALADYVELSNSSLKTRVEATMDEMFGFIADNDSAALLLGEFGGLYATDLHPELTTQRCTDFSIDIMVENGWSGGFVWSLNPESAYQYNPADTYGTFTEGVIDDDWLTANSVFLEGLVAMNDLEHLRSFPCFEVEDSSSGSSGSA